jgi:glycosyltransferase involved in cell wall biosynthesis
MKKIKVLFVGGVEPRGENEIWGGSKATYNAFKKSFINDKEVSVIFKTRSQFKQVSEISKLAKNVDLLHIDDSGIAEKMFIYNLPPPDIIGPITRSPVKVYKDNWKAKYSAEWFYKAEVIRLNYSEERKHRDLVTLINHGIDTNRLFPINNVNRNTIMWAGMIARDAKNYPLMDQIMKITKLPQGYTWKVMNKYNVIDYWNALDSACILVNTSKYESFCCAMFEARAKGVATIQRKLLNGDAHTLAPVQVEYTADAYRDKIIDLLTNKKYIELGKECREYCVNTASLKSMRDSICKIYKKAYRKKITNI